MRFWTLAVARPALLSVRCWVRPLAPRLAPGRVPSDGSLSEESRPASDWVLRDVLGWLLEGRSGFDERTTRRDFVEPLDGLRDLVRRRARASDGEVTTLG